MSGTGKRKKSPNFKEILNKNGSLFLYEFLTDRIVPPASDEVRGTLRECVKVFLKTYPDAFEEAYESERASSASEGREFGLDLALAPLYEKLLTFAKDNGYGSFNENARPMYTS